MRAELDEQGAADDEPDASDHQPRERFVEVQLRQQNRARLPR